MNWQTTVTTFVDFHWKIIAEAIANWDSGYNAAVTECGTSEFQKRYEDLWKLRASSYASPPDTSYELISQDEKLTVVEMKTRLGHDGTLENYRFVLIAINEAWRIDRILVLCSTCLGTPDHDNKCSRCSGGKSCSICDGDGTCLNYEVMADGDPILWSSNWWRVQFGAGFYWGGKRWWPDGNPKKKVECELCAGSGLCCVCDGTGECHCAKSEMPGWVDLFEVIKDG